MSEINIPEPVFLDRLGGDEIYGFGQDGNVTITADASLSRDMYYNDLTINSNCTLDTNGYRVFVAGTLTFSDTTSRIGRFSNKTTTGTLKGGFAKGVAATDTLGGKSGDQTDSEHDANQYFKGENEMFNLSVALAGHAIDADTGNYKFIGGGSGSSDGEILTTAQDGADGGDSNWSDYQVVGADGGKGSAGNSATAGVGTAGGGVVIILAKNVSGDGTVRADADDSGLEATQGTDGSPAPDATTPGNTVPGNTNPTNYGTNPTNYGANYGSNPTNYGSNPTNYSTYPGNSGSNPHTHYHWHGVWINNYGFIGYHYHYNHWHPFTNPTNYATHPGNNYSYSGNNYSYGYSYGGNTNTHPGNTNPSTTNPTVTHPGGTGGTGGTAEAGYNAGGGTVVLVTGTKPLPSGLTLAAAAGTSGTGTAGAGTVLTVYNINADDTDPGA
jgi:hypothetical protein